jgi:hypothetical protein
MLNRINRNRYVDKPVSKSLQRMRNNAALEKRRNRGIDKLHNTMNRGPSEENLPFTIFEKLFKGRPRVLEIVRNYEKGTTRIIEHYVRKQKPWGRKQMFKDLTSLEAGLMVAKYKSSLFAGGMKMFNPLPHKYFEDNIIISTIGYIPTERNFNFGPTMDTTGAYFTFHESKLYAPLGDYASCSRLFVAKNFFWLEAVVSKKSKRFERYLKALPRDFDGRIVPDYSSLVITEMKPITLK